MSGLIGGGSTIALWVVDRVIIDERVSTVVWSLHDDYVAWARERGIDAMGRRAFTKALVDLNFPVERAARDPFTQCRSARLRPAPAVQTPSTRTPRTSACRLVAPALRWLGQAVTAIRGRAHA